KRDWCNDQVIITVTTRRFFFLSLYIERREDAFISSHILQLNKKCLRQLATMLKALLRFLFQATQEQGFKRGSNPRHQLAGSRGRHQDMLRYKYFGYFAQKR